MSAASASQIARSTVPREVLVKSGPSEWPHGVMSEKELVQRIDKLLELKPGRSPANHFVLLISPHRNGNSTLMSEILPRIGLDRMVNKLGIEQSEGRWDAGQYPRLLHSLLPDYRSSRYQREILRRRYSPARLRLLFYAIHLAIPATAFLVTEILMSYGFGGFSSKPTSLLSFAQQVLRIPLWSHAMGLGVGGVVEFLQQKRESWLSRLPYRDRDETGFRLSEADFDFLRGDDGSYLPVLDILRKTLPGPSVVWIDRADGFDTFSKEALERFLAKPHQPSNRVIVLHFGAREAFWYREIKREFIEMARPDERLVEIELQPVSPEDRKRIARERGKTEEDAAAAPLIADLVEVDQPRLASLRQIWLNLLESELGQPAGDSGPALLLALLASSGVDSPKQWGTKQLQGILAPQSGTYSRWAEVFGRKPWYPNPLRLNLQLLKNPDSVPLLEFKGTVSHDPQVVVPADVRRVVLEDLRDRNGWVGSVHTFWATYYGERPGTESSDLAPMVELSWHLLNVRFPAHAEVASREALQTLGRSLLSAAVRTIKALIDLAQFDRAHSLLARMHQEVLPTDDLWSHEPFVREVERLSEQAWRLATVRGASREILAFQKLLSEKGARSSAKGIEASVAIFDLYSRAINLEEVDREQALALRIVGGDEITRAHLENLRRYALNLAFLRPTSMVIEGLEVFDLEDSAPDLREQLRDPFPSPRLDFFELLVGFQSARARLALNELVDGLRVLRQTAEKLIAAEGKRGKYDFFEESIWFLCVAEARLIGLEAFHRFGPYLFLVHEDFREILSLLFRAGLDRLDQEDLVTRLCEEVADSLDDAHLIQELCDLSLGLAYLMNAKVRYSRVLLRLGESSSGKFDVWKTGEQTAKELGCKHLQMGVFLIRSQTRKEVETCIGCLKAVCEEALRQGLVKPLGSFGLAFGDLALKLNNRELYRFASEILRFSLDQSETTSASTAAMVAHVQSTNQYAQFLRLLGEPRAALSSLSLTLDQATLPASLREEAQDAVLSSRLQACWCYEDIKDEENLEVCLRESLQTEGCDRWSGYPHLVKLRFRLALKKGQPLEEAIKEAVRAFASQGWRPSYEQRGLFALVIDLMRSCLEHKIQGRTRSAVVDAARTMIDRVSEWIGIETALEFLRLTLHLEELTDARVPGLYESFVAREALMEQRLADLDRQMGSGHPEPLLEYILHRFEHRIAFLADPDSPGQRLLEQLESGGSVSEEQIARAMARVNAVQAMEGILYLDSSLLALLQLQNQSGANESRQQSLRAALWSATEHILRVIAAGDFVHPKLASAMLTYLRISEAFSGT